MDREESVQQVDRNDPNGEREQEGGHITWVRDHEEPDNDRSRHPHQPSREAADHPLTSRTSSLEPDGARSTRLRNHCTPPASVGRVLSVAVIVDTRTLPASSRGSDSLSRSVAVPSSGGPGTSAILPTAPTAVN